MTAMLDLAPAVRRMAGLLDAVADEQLTARTPCEEYSLGDLIDHVSGLSETFVVAAGKRAAPGSTQRPSPNASRLGRQWRTRIAGQLDALAEAWRVPAAWEGMTEAGGVPLASGLAGKVALNELVVHGWDIARASGQPFDCDPRTLEVCLEVVSLLSTAGSGPGTATLFAPPRDAPTTAPLLDRLIARTGRDPQWSAD